MEQRDYQAMAIKTRDQENTERYESLAHIVEELKRLALVEYEYNIAPRGCSPDTARREAVEWMARTAEQLADVVVNAVTETFLDDPRRR
jgi:hypothetical protein